MTLLASLKGLRRPWITTDSAFPALLVRRAYCTCRDGTQMGPRHRRCIPLDIHKYGAITSILQTVRERHVVLGWFTALGRCHGDAQHGGR